MKETGRILRFLPIHLLSGFARGIPLSTKQGKGKIKKLKLSNDKIKFHNKCYCAIVAILLYVALTWLSTIGKKV